MSKQKKSGTVKPGKRKHPSPMVRQYQKQAAQLKRSNTQLRLMLAAVVSHAKDMKVAVTESDMRLMPHADLSIAPDEHGRVIVQVTVPEDEDEPEAAE